MQGSFQLLRAKQNMLSTLRVKEIRNLQKPSEDLPEHFITAVLKGTSETT